ncbi:MAG: hypothetical protein SGJ13_18745 [Actinomycetota bacterium]|nr:hypothetical protein [Actinomycetota bacterium]
MWSAIYEAIRDTDDVVTALRLEERPLREDTQFTTEVVELTP